jgi:putative sigma-54 modulation protein
MRLDIKGRQVTVTPALRELITARIAHFERQLQDAIVSVRVVFTKDKYRLHTEIVVHTRGDHILPGEAHANNWPLSVKQAFSKIEQQGQKLKGKWNGRKHKVSLNRLSDAGPPAPVEPAASSPRIIRNRRYTVKPMSIEDAALQLDGGQESFVVFRNAEIDTEAITVLYRRKDGNFGLIEPE